MQKLAAVMVAMLCLQCHAKCRDVEVPISGLVLRSDGTPIVGAVVVVSYIRYGIAESEVVHSGMAGRYSMTIHWDPVSPAKTMLEMYSCDGRLKSVTVKAIAKGFEETREAVELSNGGADVALTLLRRRE